MREKNQFKNGRKEAGLGYSVIDRVLVQHAQSPGSFSTTILNQALQHLPACTPSSKEAEEAGQEVQSHPQLKKEAEVRLGCMKPVLKTNQPKQTNKPTSEEGRVFQCHNEKDIRGNQRMRKP